MELLVIGSGIFVAVIVVIELCLYAVRHAQSVNKHKVKKRLRKLQTDDAPQTGSIYRSRLLSQIPSLDKILRNIPGLVQLDRLVEQADAKYPLGFYLLLSLTLMAFGWIAIGIVKYGILLRILGTMTLGLLPYVMLLRKKQVRVKKFQVQLPEALDLIGRALKAGHAFTSGMKMAADEFHAPLGPEFQQVVDEINFGVGVPEALHHLAQRIDSAELKFFVVSVILQRETGGNLAEIMGSLADLMRERFKLEGKIRVLSAEGRMSGWVLVLLPFFVLAFLKIKNPDYINLLFTEPAGRMMSFWGLIFMALGVLVIKKMISIRV
jgi:tight adherence protein B